jgi:hypothetical protein
MRLISSHPNNIYGRTEILAMKNDKILRSKRIYNDTGLGWHAFGVVRRHKHVLLLKACLSRQRREKHATQVLLVCANNYCLLCLFWYNMVKSEGNMIRFAIIILLLLISISIVSFGQEALPDGRYLPDGTYQVRNINTTLPDPQVGVGVEDKAPDLREEIESITWGPDVRLSQPPLSAFYPALVEDHNGYVHIVVSDNGYASPFYVRSMDQGNSWQDGHYQWEPRSPVAYHYVLFANGDTITMPFSGYGTFRSAYSSDKGESWSDWRLPQWDPPPASSVQRGSVIYSAGSMGQISKVYFSTNYGVSWHDEFPYLTPSMTKDLAVTNNALHIVQDDDGQENIYYNSLRFSDTTWAANFRLSDSLPLGSFYPKIISWGSNNLYVIWTDYKYSPYSWTGDILARCSTDEGLNWGPEQQLTFNHLALNKNILARNDSLFLVYDEIVFDGRTNTEEIFFNLSTDGGQNWGEPLRLTYADYRSIYASIAVAGNRIHVAWCDARDDTAYGNRNAIYYKRGILGNAEGVENGNEKPIALPMITLEAYPNPFNSTTTITVVHSIDDLPICIFDVSGRLITTLKTDKGKAYWDAKGYASGIYFARAKGANSDKFIKLILMK